MRLEIAIVLTFFALLAAVAAHHAYEIYSCNDGEFVTDTDGSLDCVGSNHYMSCSPSKHFVCHDPLPNTTYR